MAWAWPYPITFDEKLPSGPNGSEYGAAEYDLTQWVNGYFIEFPILKIQNFSTECVKF